MTQMLVSVLASYQGVMMPTDWKRGAPATELLWNYPPNVCTRQLGTLW